MRLGSVRDLMGNRPVLMDPSASGPDPVYVVWTGMTNGGKWENLTIISAGRYGIPSTPLGAGEFPKTFGHYHGTKVDETYHLVDGEGILQLQKKHFEEKMWVPEVVDEVFLVKVNAGEEVVIRPEYGHSWSNVGETPLLSYDNWRAGHDPTDYAMIEKLQGLAYYLIDEDGTPKAVANPKYRDLPEPVWMSAEEYMKGGDNRWQK